MKIAIAGLGKMGGQIAKVLLEDRHIVIAYDVDAGRVDELAQIGAMPAFTPRSAVELFHDEPVIVWLMVPASIIDHVVDGWAEVLPQGSILIDGGNSDYRNDAARATRLADHGISLVDIGTSGGVWGIKNGFSMMVGGDEAAYTTILPVLDTLAHPRGGHAYFGASGSGHFVKMVHNAVEYGMMESLAEGYRVLQDGPYRIDLATAGDVWQQSSVVTSWLNDLTRQVLHENPTLNDISGEVAESGEARWTLETAQQYSITMPAVQAAFDVRVASQQGDVNFATKLLAAMRTKFGGHDINGKQ